MLSIIKELSEGSLSGIFSGIRGLISEFHSSPEEKQKALEAVMAYESKLYQIASSIDLAQLEVNKVEAANSSRFVSGWRPFIGWVCGGGLTYEVIVRDLLNWFLMLSGTPLLPTLNNEILWMTMSSMLGIAGLRTFEKLKGVARS